MNVFKQKGSVLSLYMFFFAVLLSGCVHNGDQNSSSGEPRPAFHVKANEAVVFNLETGTVSEWKDVTGYGRDLEPPSNSSYHSANRTLDKDGNPCISNGFMETYGRNTMEDTYTESSFDSFSGTMAEKFFHPDIFIVSTKKADDNFYFYSSFGDTSTGQLQIYMLPTGVEVNSHMRLEYEEGKEELLDVLNVSIRSDGLVHVLRNGVELDNFMYSDTSIGKYIGLLNKNVSIYEILVFQNLTETEREKINTDLMKQYQVNARP